MTAHLTASAKEIIPYAERVEESGFDGGRVFALRTEVPEVVSIRGSLLTYPDFEAGDSLLQRLTVAMLDKGSRRRDRFEIAELLENRGAELRFSSDGERATFSAKTLRGDLPTVVELIAEQLREPGFDGEQFEFEKARLAASLHRRLESTSLQAADALARRLYPPAHPNYADDASDELKRLASITLDQVREYHQRHFGANEMIAVLVGDVPEGYRSAVSQAFAGWNASEPGAAYATRSTRKAAGRTEVPMSDRQNLDVTMGHGVGLLRDDPEFLPLYVGNYVLGGNFSARLMTRIRDEMGLTYGIASSLVDVDVSHGGHFEVSVTLSQEVLERGIEETVNEVRRFVSDGVTEDEVEEKKTTITGSYKVGLATTGGLALAMIVNIQRGFGVAYLDRFPALIAGIGAADVNAAIERHLSPDDMHIAVAGTLPASSGE